jgi:hypothetical protein
LFFFGRAGIVDMFGFFGYEWLMVTGKLSTSGTPCHLLQRRTENIKQVQSTLHLSDSLLQIGAETQVIKYSTPSSEAVHPSRGELAQLRKV